MSRWTRFYSSIVAFATHAQLRLSQQRCQNSFDALCKSLAVALWPYLTAPLAGFGLVNYAMLAPESCSAASSPIALYSRVISNEAATIPQNFACILHFVCRRCSRHVAVVSELGSAMVCRGNLRRCACLLRQAGFAQLSASFRAL